MQGTAAKEGVKVMLRREDGRFLFRLCRPTKGDIQQHHNTVQFREFPNVLTESVYHDVTTELDLGIVGVDKLQYLGRFMNTPFGAP